jgi:hypothetical protein
VNIEWTDTHVQQYQTWEEFHKEHPDADVQFIDGKFLVGTCEACDKPILQGDEYIQDDDGIRLCKACADQAPEEVEDT